MYRVLLADDEEWILTNLKKSIPWEREGLELAHACLDGREAADAMIALNPDVVVTDIRMPGMSGLDLLKLGRSRNPMLQVILISGYTEFAYAQKALQLGAIGYIVKPFDEEELITLLRKASLALAAHRGTPRAEHDAVAGLVSASSVKPADIPVKLLSSAYRVLAVEMDTSFPSGDLIPLSFQTDSPRRLFLLPEVDWPALLIRLEQTPMDIRLSIGASHVHDMPEQLPFAIEEATLASYRCFFPTLPDNPVPDVYPENEWELFFQCIPTVMRNHDLAGLLRLLDEASDKARRGQMGIRHALRLYHAIVIPMAQAVPDNADRYIQSIQRLHRRFTRVDAMLDFLAEIVLQGLRPQTWRDDVSRPCNPAFQGIIDWIRRHFYKDIALIDIARQFSLHPNHVSHLFKKEMNTSFTLFVTRLRMAYATGLLETTELPVHEVAEKSGYEDYFYFCRIFKKVTGMTATEYREAHKPT